MDAHPHPLLGHLDRLMDELHAQVPRAINDWDEDGVHRARVATRRLSAALRLAEPVVRKKRRKALGRALRDLRRRLGPLRDADVMLGHLQELAAANGSKHAGAVAWLWARLQERREALRQASKEGRGAGQVLADLGAWHPVREQIDEAAGQLPRLLAESLHLQLDAFAEQAARVAAGAESKPDTPHYHDPHELRIAGKALRYTLEMAVAQGHDLPASVMKTFKRMQELLGAWHDLVVLTDMAVRVSLEELLSHRDPTAQEAVLDLARTTLRRSAKELAQFRKLWAAKGEQLAAVIRRAFPLTPQLQASGDAAPQPPPPPEPASGSETGPGPADSTGAAAPAASPPASPSDAS
jgi:CHAD domain-containing protein